MRLLWHKDAVGVSQSSSLIVCIKDDADQLKNIETFRTQLSLKEFILVDDFSDKETKSALENLSKEVRLIHAEVDIKGKKQALTTGIHASSSHILVLSDIDCIPASNQWIELMSGKISKNIGIVLGYGGYRKLKGFLNKFIRFECVMTATQYMSYAKAGMPYMGVGRNICYKKSLFNKVNGLDSHMNIPSGDDDLFIQAVANSNNTTISLDPKSFTYSEPPNTWKSYYFQKARHISTSIAYKWQSKILLAVYAISHISFYVFLVLSLIFEGFCLPFLGYFGFLIISWIIFGRISTVYKEPDLKFWYPLLDVVYLFYFLFLTPYLIFRRNIW